MAVARSRRRESMDEPTRRTWSKPELIVLVRSGPEEAVLNACKSATAPALGAGTGEGCQGHADGCFGCEFNEAS